MSTLARIGLALAVVFVLINLFGVAWAAWHREVLHTGIHVVLLVPGVFVVSRLTARRTEVG